MSPPEVLLRGIELTRRWGGLVAVDRVSLELARGSVHAVIGTNGAGKSTLINLLSGEFPPSAGQVRLVFLGEALLLAMACGKTRRGTCSETRCAGSVTVWPATVSEVNEQGLLSWFEGLLQDLLKRS